MRAWFCGLALWASVVSGAVAQAPRQAGLPVRPAVSLQPGPAGAAFQFVGEAARVGPDRADGLTPWIGLEAGLIIQPDWPTLQAQLRSAPQEAACPLVRASRSIILLPRPDGSWERFAFVESSIMAPELQAQVPMIRTYLGQGLDNPAATVRFDVTTTGFHAQVLAPSRAGEPSVYYVDPVFKGDTATHAVYWHGDLSPLAGGAMACGTDLPVSSLAPAMAQRGSPGIEVTRRVLRLAVACTGEFTQRVSAPGPASALTALSVVTTTVNRMNQIYEIDCAVRYVLVSGELALIMSDPLIDPFTSEDVAHPTYSANEAARANENQSFLDFAVGSGNYDAGHLFHGVNNGYAGRCFATACGSGKARTTSAHSSPSGDYFSVELVAHESGHQLGASHTFNGNQGSCGNAGEYQAATAYEPGGGATIMSYAGNCGTDSYLAAVPPAAAPIPMFNFSAIQQIRAFVSGGCGAAQATGNFEPLALADSPWNAPTRTPFTLFGTSVEPDFGDVCSYSWEEADLGPAGPPTADTGNGAPLIRVLPPAASGDRDIPTVSSLLLLTPTPGVNLPIFTRARQFRLVVRDNRAGAGGVGITNITVNFTDKGAAFRVTSPTASSQWCGGSQVDVVWDPVGTFNSPIFEPNVDIQLSFDGGSTFPWTLLGNAANIGLARVTVPSGFSTTSAVVRVKARNSNFFALSPLFKLSSAAPTIAVQPQGAAVCPGTTVRLQFTPGGGAPFGRSAGGQFGSYIWKRNGADWFATNVPYVDFSPAGSGDTGDYTVELSNACGTVTSQAARLQVGLSIDNLPFPTSEWAPCESRSLAVAVRGVGAITYQWRKNGIPLAPSARVSGVNASTLAFNGVHWDDEGAYQCFVQDSCGSLLLGPFTVKVPAEPGWIKRDPSGPTPPARLAHAMAYDAARGVVVLHGGTGRDQFGQAVQLGDTWEFNGTVWTQKFPVHSPGFVNSHAMTYDSARQRVVLFGGAHPLCSTCAQPPRAETWEWDGVDWTLRTTTGPADAQAAYPALAYDAAAQRTILYTGTNTGATQYRGETWSYDGGAGAWTLINSTTGPGTANGYPSMYFDPVRGKRTMYDFSLDLGVSATYPAFWEWNDATGWSISSSDTGGLWQGNQQPYPWCALASNTWVFNTFRKWGESGLMTVIPPGGGGFWNGTYLYLGGDQSPIRLITNNSFGVTQAAQVWDSARRCVVVFGGNQQYPGAANSGKPVSTLYERHYADEVKVLDQPAPIQADPGTSAAFRVVAAGWGTLTYQWQRRPAGGDWGNIVGATSPTLTLNNLQPADAGQYRCLVANSCGGVLSDPALLSVGPPPCNIADLTSVGGTIEDPGSPDGQLTVDDIIMFVNLFSDGAGCPGPAPCNRADVTGIGGPPEAPDGQLTVDDLIAFVNGFGEGC